MIEYNKQRLARAKEEKVDIKQMAVAELMAWGWDPADAMLAVGLLKTSDDEEVARHASITFVAKNEFDALYKKRVKQLRNGSVIDEYKKIHPTPGTPLSKRGRMRNDGTVSGRPAWQGPVEDPLDDKEILSSMLQTIRALEPNDPKRADLLDKYDRLKRRQGTGEDDTTIHFYLPRPECDTCPFRGGHVINDPASENEETEPAPPVKRRVGRPRKSTNTGETQKTE